MTSIVYYCADYIIVPFEQLSLRKSLVDMFHEHGISWIATLEKIIYRKWTITFNKADKNTFQTLASQIQLPTEITSNCSIITNISEIVRQKSLLPNVNTSPEWCDNFPRFTE